jgi:hypothetical protein
MRRFMAVLAALCVSLAGFLILASAVAPPAATSVTTHGLPIEIRMPDRKLYRIHVD